MAQSAALLTRIVASSVSATIQAGKIIRDVLSKGGLNIVEKGKNDLQTEADRCAQRCIVTSLSRQFPNVTIIGGMDRHRSSSRGVTIEITSPPRRH